MKRLTLFVLTATLLLTTVARAQTAKFDNTSLFGKYGFHTNALSLGNVAGTNGPAYPFAISGYYQFDGNGHLVGKDTLSTQGAILHRQYAGTYHVNLDGTGTLTLNVSSTFHPQGDFVIVHGGEQIEIIFAVPGNLNAFSLERQ